jgi:hypothetical protein
MPRPTERAQLRQETRWRWEVLPLLQGRARIVTTDGVSVDQFW